MIASGVFAGVFTRDWAAARADRGGETFGAALDKIGYRGPETCGDHKLSAFFEVHIEQGPYLEAEGKDIGVVTGVQAMRWYEVTVTGQDTHAGTTPMPRRHDALLGAARLVEAVNAAALRDTERGRHRRPARSEARLAQRGAGRSVLHHRPARSRSGRARPHGKRHRRGGEKARRRARPADRASRTSGRSRRVRSTPIASPRCAPPRGLRLFDAAT